MTQLLHVCARQVPCGFKHNPCKNGCHFWGKTSEEAAPGEEVSFPCKPTQLEGVSSTTTAPTEMFLELKPVLCDRLCQVCLLSAQVRNCVSCTF